MTKQLTIHDLKQFSSPYLNEGFKQDQFEILSITLEENSLTAQINIINFAMPSDGLFHLSSITSSRISQQLAIIYTYASLNKPKDAEIYYLGEHWIYKKAITDPKNISIHMKNISKKETAKGVIYFCEGSINDSFFCKKASWFKPHQNIHTER